MKARMIGGAGKVAEVDGGFFGGYVKPANLKENRRDRRLAKNQNGKRQCVVIVRERGGNSVPAVFKSESHAANFIKARVANGTKLNADEAGLAGITCTRISRSPGSTMKRRTALMTHAPIGAESHFSRLRRAEIGHHHHVAGTYLLVILR